MRRDDLIVHVSQNRNWGPSIGKILSGKKNEGTGLVSEKTEALFAELN